MSQEKKKLAKMKDPFLARESRSVLRKIICKSIFVFSSLTYKICSPVVRLFLPISKEIALVEDLSTPIDRKKYYPVLNFVGLVRQHGYTAEAYSVQTCDGYILTLHRISAGPSNPRAFGKPVAFLQHGMLMTSDSFVLIGPENDLAYLLVNAGYDVWLGNARGNTYSKQHVSMDPKNPAFWDFSQHEIAIYDLPASIDRILEITKAEKIRYYGFSMGTMLSYIMLSMRPEYNEKIHVIYSLAPVAFWKHPLRRIVKDIDIVFRYVLEYFDHFNVHEVFPQTAIHAFMGDKFFVQNNRLRLFVCSYIVCRILAIDFKRINKTLLSQIITRTCAGTSKMVLIHFYQNYKLNEFKAYDYGAEINFLKYGQEAPPIYDLSNVTAPVSLWYARNEDVVNANDVEDLHEILPNVISLNEVNNESFNHSDFLWAGDARQLVYEHIIEK